MVALPAAMFRLPDAPQDLGALLTTSVRLWQASWRATFGYSLLVGLAGLLPALAFGELVAALLRESIPLLLRDAAPWLPLRGSVDPLGLLQAARDWLLAPRTLVAFALALLLALAGIQLVIHRQARIGLGLDAPWLAATRAALGRLLAGLGAWAVYFLLLLFCLLPLLLLAAVLYAAALQVAQLETLVLILLALLFGGLAASVPLAWLSVAAGFAPFASAIDASGPFAAQRLSLRRVRGHWLHAAVAVTVPVLLYLAAASLVSTLALVACAATAWILGGWGALLQGEWVAWAHWLGLAPTAVALPLATAGGVAAWHDLGLRRPTG